MSGFSPEWLALREPVDHRSRDARLARQLATRFARQDSVTVVDLGCGTGSNIRATSALLGAQQDWTLVDYDERLLAVARERISAWADRSMPFGNGLFLDKGGKSLIARFVQADLTNDLDRALGESPDLVTASALFDLCSAEFIQRFAAAVAGRRAVFYTVLTYNGIQRWTPAHAADEAMSAAFHAHQMTDKGFGAAAGPMAPAALAGAFRSAGYAIGEGDSPWVLGAKDRALIDQLIPGFAGAVGENGGLRAKTLGDWLSLRRTAAVVGHTDTLATPA